MLLPILVMALYLRTLYRRIDDRSLNLVGSDVVAFFFAYLIGGMISMAGAYAVSSAVRTPTIVMWLGIVVAWSASHSLRWRPKLGLASASLFLLLAVFLSYVAYEHFLRTADKPFWAAEEVQRWSACTDNLKEIGKAMAMYAGENDGKLPVEGWTDWLAEYTEPTDFQCPGLPNSVGYTMNSEAMGLKTDWADPMFVVAYDGVGGPNRTAAGPAGVHWSHGRGEIAMVLLFTGNTERMAKYRLFRYIWDRKTALDPPERNPFSREE